MTESQAGRRSSMGLVVGVGLAALLGLLAWFVFFRDTSPEAVDSQAQAEARAAAATNAAENEGAESSAEDGQFDSGGGTSAAGTWTIDSSIGTFDDACLTEVCGSNFVGFRIDEELVGIGAKTVVGRTDAVTGSMTVEGTTITAVDITVDMTQLRTDDPGRNAAIKGATGGLETQKFPEATFSLTQPIEMGADPVEGAAVNADATGELTVHGVTREVTLPLTAELQAGLVVIYGTLADIELADFDIPKPSAIVVLSVEETADMELQLFFSR